MNKRQLINYCRKRLQRSKHIRHIKFWFNFEFELLEGTFDKRIKEKEKKMAEINIKINLDNAAFNEDHQAETRRILDGIVKEKTPLRHGELLRDVNGNTVGCITYKE
jgi:hypothetical protein